MSAVRLFLALTVLAVVTSGCRSEATEPNAVAANRAKAIAVLDAANAYARDELAILLTAGLPDDVGQYYYGDHLGMNVTLTLMSGGHYSMTWTGCQGLYGAGVGAWKLTEDRVLLLEPIEERGAVAEHPFRKLHVRLLERKPILIPDGDLHRFREQGATSLTCFMDSNVVRAQWLREP